MKIAKIHIWHALLFLALGLGLGWLLFHSPQKETPPAVDSAQAQTIWTCSMHPQIRQAEPGLCPLCGMELIPLEEGGQESSPVRLEMTEAAVKLADIRTTKVGKNTPQGKELFLNGKVVIDERRLHSQVTHVGGRIEALFVNSTGEQVSKGQKLASIYSPALVNAQKELLEALRYKESTPGLLEAAREKLRQLRLTDVQIAGIEERGRVSPVLDIFAEASGVVLTRKVAVGDYVQEGQVLLELVNLERLWVNFEAYETDLPFIRKGNSIDFELAGKSYSEKVTYIDPLIDPQSRIAQVRVEVANPRGRLKPEMFVRGKVRGTQRQTPTESLNVPRSAVLWTGKRSLVYVKVPGKNVPTFEAREVSLGEAMGAYYLIEAGLDEGEEVVTYGTFTVDAAAQLNGKGSMMNREVFVKGTEADDEKKQIPDYIAQTPAAFQRQIQEVVQAYLPLKDALVASETDSRKHIKAISKALESADMSQLEGEAHTTWMTLQRRIQDALKAFSQQEDLEAQRNAFIELSDALIFAAKAYGAGEKLYVQFCPMANNDQGAYWLSGQSEILNPYFGDKMLRCGWVEDSVLSNEY